MSVGRVGCYLLSVPDSIAEYTTFDTVFRPPSHNSTESGVRLEFLQDGRGQHLEEGPLLDHHQYY